MRFLAALCLLTVVACGQPEDGDNDSELDGRNYQRRYPSRPALSLTPGTLCRQPDEYRYAERIPYCRRGVSTSLKTRVIELYDAKLSYTIEKMPRDKFKIDHYVPLCLGGANDSTNLWPQHESVYRITDPLEVKFCALLERGRMKHAEAVRRIKHAKLNLHEVPRVIEELDERLDE